MNINFIVKGFSMYKKGCGVLTGRVLSGILQLIVLFPFNAYAQSTDRREAAVWQNAETAFEYAENRRSGDFLEQLGMAHSVKPNPITVQSAKQWCGDDRVILEYIIGGPDNSLSPEETCCIVLTKDTDRIVALDPAFDYSGMVESLRMKIVPAKDGNGNIGDVRIDNCMSIMQKASVVCNYQQTHGSIYFNDA
jgi:hypothetical protein